MFDFSKLKHPIIQAPMAGGINTPEMVSAAINAGAVGSYGFAYSSPGKISEDINAARNLRNAETQGALNCNFFVFPEKIKYSTQDLDGPLDALRSLDFVGKLELEIPKPPFFLDLETQLEPIWMEPPEILSFHFGVPDKEIISKAHAFDVSVGITATSLEEARRVEQSGADFIVAQGFEAGGHRGIHDPDGDDDKLKTLELIQRLSSSSKLPLVAAGGIMNRNQLIEIIETGATAVQMGTVFLTCAESGASEAYKKMLLDQKHRSTVFTQAFSGRPARAIENEFVTLMEGQALLPFPLQNKITASIRKYASKLENPEYQSLWAGVNYPECRKETVAELIERMSWKERS